MNAAELRTTEYPPLEFAAEGVIPFGQLTVIGGTAKAARKSWLMGALALGASAGSDWIGFACHEAPVLFIGNEDSPRRQQSRLKTLQGEQERSKDADQRLTIETGTSWPTHAEGGLELIKLWAELEARPSVVIIDTLVNFWEVPGFINRDRRLIRELANFAHETGVALVVVMHLRKGKIREGTNWTDNLAGSSGVSAAADVLCGVDALLGATVGRLLITGKDVESQTLGLELGANGCWEVTAEAATASGPEMSAERKLLVAIVGQGAGGLTAGEIHEAAPYGPTGKPWTSDNVRQNLYQAWKAGAIVNDGGRFYTHEQMGGQGELFRPSEAAGFVPRIVASN